MAQTDFDDAIDQLYAAAPEEFVAERGRLAKELKKDGNADEASQLAKLRKPTAAAWALNHTAREDPGAVEDWMQSAEALREATAAGGEGLREAMAANRDATVRLSGAVREAARAARRPLSEPMLERVRTLLRAAAADEGLAERVRAGRVTEEQGAGVMPGPPASPRPRATAAPKSREPEGAAAEHRAARIAELEHRVALAREEARRRRADVDRSESAATAAGHRVEEARRALRRAESEAEAARGVVRDAEDAAASAERHLEELRELLHDAEG